MTRSQFFATITGAGATALTPIAQEEPAENPAKSARRLLALEFPVGPRYDASTVARLKEALKPYCDRYNFDVIVIQDGGTFQRIF